jgi:hypothetical protein
MQIKRRAEVVLRGKEQEVLGKREGLKGVEKTHAAAEYVSRAGLDVCLSMLVTCMK